MEIKRAPIISIPEESSQICSNLKSMQGEIGTWELRIAERKNTGRRKFPALSRKKASARKKTGDSHGAREQSIGRGVCLPLLGILREGMSNNAARHGKGKISKGRKQVGHAR